MSENTNVVGNSFLDGRSNAGRFDLTSIALHWLTTVLVGAQFATAWLLSRPGANVEALLTAHRSTGMFVWAVVIARIAWRSYFAELPPFPASMPKLQQWAAKLNEYGLYVPLLLQPLTGNTGVLFRGRPFVLFAWEMPALLTPNKTIYEVLDSVHELDAAALLGLIGLHAAAALFHGVVLRDGVLQRMLPWTAR